MILDGWPTQNPRMCVRIHTNTYAEIVWMCEKEWKVLFMAKQRVPKWALALWVGSSCRGFIISWSMNRSYWGNDFELIPNWCRCFKMASLICSVFGDVKSYVDASPPDPTKSELETKYYYVSSGNEMKSENRRGVARWMWNKWRRCHNFPPTHNPPPSDDQLKGFVS